MEITTTKSFLKASGPIKWTNKYDCPASYNYNEDGYVITDEVYPKLTVNTLPYLWNTYTTTEMIYYNLLVLYYLNPSKPTSILKSAVRNRLNQAFLHTRDVVEEDMEDAMIAFSNFEGDIVDALPTDFCKMDTVWYSNWCDIQNTTAIKFKLKVDYIDAVRSIMSTNTKYKTKEVSTETSFPTRTIGRYWKRKGLTPPIRIATAISEAYIELSESGITSPTRSQLANASGLSERTIYKKLSEKL